MSTLTIKSINDQHTFEPILTESDRNNWRGSPRKTFSATEIGIIKDMADKRCTLNEIGHMFNVSRTVFKAIRENESHPNYFALIDIFGQIKRRQRHKPTKRQIALKAQESKDQSIYDELNSIAINHLLEELMSSDNSHINAQDRETVKEYKYLRKALAKYLRLNDKNDPSYIHSKALFDKVTKELINVTRKVYDDEGKQSKEPKD